MITQIPVWIIVSGGIVVVILGAILITMFFGNIGRYSGRSKRYQLRGKVKKQ